MEEIQMTAVAVASPLPNKPFQVYQEIDLSFTENLIPVNVPVKQFDNNARRVRCRLFQDAVAYQIPDGTIVSYSGTRPDGALFQYSNETRPELVAVVDGAIILTITSFMTEVYGRYPIDVFLLTDEGDVLGSFNLILRVEKAAVKNRKIATLTYKQCLDATINGFQGFSITEDGYLALVADDELGLIQGSYSITEEGYLQYETWDVLGLVFFVDDGLNMEIAYGIDAERRK